MRRRRSGSVAPRVRPKGYGFLFLLATSWANGDGDTDFAPHRTGRRRSRARPRFRITQRAGAYPCLRSPPGEQGSIPGEQTGSGMDPPVFWAGNTGKSQTTHPVSPTLTARERGKAEQSGRMAQSVYCRNAEIEWLFLFRLQPPPQSVRGAGTRRIRSGYRLWTERSSLRASSISLLGAPGRNVSILAEQARASRDHAPGFLWQWKPW